MDAFAAMLRRVGLILACLAYTTSQPASPVQNLTVPAPEGSAKSYDYSLSGTDWPGLCQTGRRQSPINLVSGSETFLLDYPAALRPNLDFGTGRAVQVINRGRYFEIDWQTLRPPNATITLGALFGQPNQQGPGVVGHNGTIVPGNGEDRVPLTPLQWHMHTPSEHSVDGKLSLVEAHLVTSVSNLSVPACGTGCIAVFAVLYDIAEDTAQLNPFLTPFLYDLPLQIGPQYATNLTSDFVLDFASYFPLNTRGFVTYSGSLTTPPCTENVLWTVLLNHPTLSISQVESLNDVAAATVRPLQCYPISASNPNLQRAPQANGTFQICSAQGQRENNRYPQPSNARPIFRYN